MTKIKQIDREASDKLGCGYCPDSMNDYAAELFAAHREAAMIEGARMALEAVDRSDIDPAQIIKEAGDDQ